MEERKIQKEPEDMEKNNKEFKGVEIKNDGAHLDTVSFRQDVPECVVKLAEIHLMASPQQSLGVRSESHFQTLTEQLKNSFL